MDRIFLQTTLGTTFRFFQIRDGNSLKELGRQKTLCRASKEIWLTIGHEGKAVNQSALQFFSLKVLYLLRQNFCFRRGLFFFITGQRLWKEKQKKDSTRHFQASSVYKVY